MKPIWMIILPVVFLAKSPFTRDFCDICDICPSGTYTIAQAVPNYLGNSNGQKSSAFDIEVKRIFYYQDSGPLLDMLLF